MFSAQFSVSAWSFRICFLGGLIITKPVLGEVRCVRLGWECMSGFVCLLYVFSSRGFELQSITVLFFKWFILLLLLFLVKQNCGHICFSRVGPGLQRRKSIGDILCAFSMCFWTQIFFLSTWKLKRDIWLSYILYINLCINGSLFSWATV